MVNGKEGLSLRSMFHLLGVWAYAQCSIYWGFERTLNVYFLEGLSVRSMSTFAGVWAYAQWHIFEGFERTLNDTFSLNIFTWIVSTIKACNYNWPGSCIKTTLPKATVTSPGPVNLGVVYPTVTTPAALGSKSVYLRCPIRTLTWKLTALLLSNVKGKWICIYHNSCA